ncbi:MAG: hypothetical protein ACREK7_01495 [Gemmatimonadota bacterium]
MMTNRKLQKDIERWLAAEAEAGTEEAEMAFGTALAALPRLEPRAGFAERVMVAFRPAPVVRRLAWLGWGWKAATAGALATVAVALGLLPTAGISVDLPSAAAVVDAATGGVTWLAGWLANGLEVWSFLARIGNAIGVAIATPQIGIALMATAMIGAAALYELNRLLVPERRTA